MLPEMSCLQFLVVQLLFAGPQGCKELRRNLQTVGVKISPPSLCRLMHRMENAGYLQARLDSAASGCRFVRPRLFDVTDLGVNLWKQVREFYTAFSGPPAELVPLVTEEGPLSHLPRKERRTILRRRTKKQIREMFESRLNGDSL